MHKLERGEAPTCLSRFKHGRDDWKEVTPEDKKEIWTALEAMQSKFCAYCERELINMKGHIEHLRRRSDSPQHVFDWNNLFGSCNTKSTCGKHKDSPKIRTSYQVEDLIKPDEEDPEAFLQFASDGSVFARQGLNQNDHKRANQTITVFNLNDDNKGVDQSGVLKAVRREAVRPHLETAKSLSELEKEGATLAQLKAFAWEEYEMVAEVAFKTAIKHVLLGAIPLES